MRKTDKLKSTAFVLGAGFSRSANLPVQAELEAQLLSEEFHDPIDRVITAALKEFLDEVFGWSDQYPIPALEDIFTIVDLSAGNGHTLGVKYPPKMLRALRRMLVYRVFSILDRPLHYSDDILALLTRFCRLGSRSSFVVLNWDIVLEQHFAQALPGTAIDYCCPCYDWVNPAAAEKVAGIQICKMYGLVNWMYCENCRSLFFDLQRKLALRTKAELVPSDFQLFDAGHGHALFDAALDDNADDRSCKSCGNRLSSHIATFSYRKSFRTPAYSSMWYHAERLLAEATRWIFIGYSLPEADYELKHLLKSAQLSLKHLQRGRRVEVVVLGDAATRDKYQRFFGAQLVEFYDGGLAGYVASLPASEQLPDRSVGQA